MPIRNAKYYGIFTPFYIQFSKDEPQVPRQVWLHAILRAMIADQLSSHISQRICVLDETITLKSSLSKGIYGENLWESIDEMLGLKLRSNSAQLEKTKQPSLYVCIARRQQELPSTEKFFVIIADVNEKTILLFDPLATEHDAQRQNEVERNIILKARELCPKDIIKRGEMIEKMRAEAAHSEHDPMLQVLHQKIGAAVPQSYTLRIVRSASSFSEPQVCQKNLESACSFYALNTAMNFVRGFALSQQRSGAQHTQIREMFGSLPERASTRFALMIQKNNCNSNLPCEHVMLADKQLWRELFRESKLDPLDAEILLDYLKLARVFDGQNSSVSQDDFCKAKGIKTIKDIQESIYKIVFYKEKQTDFVSLMHYVKTEIFKNAVVRSEEYFDALFNMYPLTSNMIENIKSYLRHASMMDGYKAEEGLPHVLPYHQNLEEISLATRRISVGSNSVSASNEEDDKHNAFDDFLDFYVPDLQLEEVFSSNDCSSRVQMAFQTKLLALLETGNMSELQRLIGYAEHTKFKQECSVHAFNGKSGLIYKSDMLRRDEISDNFSESSLIVSVLSEFKKEHERGRPNAFVVIQDVPSYLLDDEDEPSDYDSTDWLDFFKDIQSKMTATPGLIVIPFVAKHSVSLLVVDQVRWQIGFYDPCCSSRKRFMQSDDPIHVKARQISRRLCQMLHSASNHDDDNQIEEYSLNIIASANQNDAVHEGTSNKKARKNKIISYEDQSILVCTAAIEAMANFFSQKGLGGLKVNDASENVGRMRLHLATLQNEAVNRRSHTASSSREHACSVPVQFKIDDQLLDRVLISSSLNNFLKEVLLIAYHGGDYATQHEEELYVLFGFSVQSDIEMMHAVHSLLQKPEVQKQKMFVMKNYFEQRLKDIFPISEHREIMSLYFERIGLYGTENFDFSNSKTCQYLGIDSYQSLIKWVLECSDCHSPRIKNSERDFILESVSFEIREMSRKQNRLRLDKLISKNNFSANKVMLLEHYLGGRGFLDGGDHVEFVRDVVTDYLQVSNRRSLVQEIYKILDSGGVDTVDALLLQMNKAIFNSLEQTHSHRKIEKVLNPTAWTIGKPNQTTGAWLNAFNRTAERQAQVGAVVVDADSEQEPSAPSSCVNSSITSKRNDAEQQVPSDSNHGRLASSVELPVVDLLRQSEMVLQSDSEQGSTLAKHLKTNPFVNR